MNRRSDHKGKRINASEVVRRKGIWLLIDGYNLMHVTRFKPMGQDTGELRRCREGLVAMLAQQLSAKQYRDVTVVFDAVYAPKNLPDRYQFQHIHVRFAREENTADDLIAKLVVEYTAAKQLVVVSSDHRVQNAARRRKATVMDSDVWFDAVLDYRPIDSADSGETALGKALETTDVETETKADERAVFDPGELAKFKAEMASPQVDDDDSSKEKDELEFENPFPEGYFDDLDDLDV